MSPGVPISSPAARSVEPPSFSAVPLWSGRIFTALVVLFLLLDGIGKVMKVSAAGVRLGLSENLIVATGVTRLLSTILYVIPRTSILGAILPTGHPGGAVSCQLRVGNPLFSQTLFPVYFGVTLWLERYFCEARLRAGSFARLI